MPGLMYVAGLLSFQATKERRHIQPTIYRSQPTTPLRMLITAWWGNFAEASSALIALSALIPRFEIKDRQDGEKGGYACHTCD